VGSFRPQKTHNITLLFGNTLLSHSRNFHCWNQPLNMCLRVFYLECHEGDTHRKPITSITSVLLPFVVYLLTVSRINAHWKSVQPTGEMIKTNSVLRTYTSFNDVIVSIIRLKWLPDLKKTVWVLSKELLFSSWQWRSVSLFILEVKKVDFLDQSGIKWNLVWIMKSHLVCFKSEQ
jgi:hypothetical protein